MEQEEKTSFKKFELFVWQVEPRQTMFTLQHLTGLLILFSDKPVNYISISSIFKIMPLFPAIFFKFFY